MYLELIFSIVPALILLPILKFQSADTTGQEGLVFKTVLDQKLTVPGPDIVATSLELTFGPANSGVGPHYHSGPVVGYVLEGDFLFQMKDKPVTIIREGGSFYETDGEIHVWGANASNSTRCRIIATVLGRPGEPLTTFVDNYERESYEEALALAAKGQ